MPTDDINATTHEITALLQQVAKGDAASSERLFRVVYTELRAMAAGKLGAERVDHSWQPSDLVGEWVRKLGSEIAFMNRRHFFGAASRAMRQLLVDHARSRGAAKRGGDWTRVEIESLEQVSGQDSADAVLNVERAMVALARDKPTEARLYELRHFGGLSSREIAEVEEVPLRTVQAKLAIASAHVRKQAGGAI